MSQHPLTKKSSFILLAMLIASGTASGNLREDLRWNQKLCKTYSPDGYKCYECAFHAYKDKDGVCQNVSDFCKTWDDKTGHCLSCFQGYGYPVKGVCSSTPVTNEKPPVGDTDDHCAKYGYLDSKNKWSKIWTKDCRKVCSQCDQGYFLTSSYKCVKLPSNCVEVTDSGACTKCAKNYFLDQKGICCPKKIGFPEDQKSCDHKSCEDSCKHDHESCSQKECQSKKVGDCDSHSKKQDCDSKKSVKKDCDQESKKSVKKDCDQESKKSVKKDCDQESKKSVKKDCDQESKKSVKKDCDQESKKSVKKDCDQQSKKSVKKDCDQESKKSVKKDCDEESKKSVKKDCDQQSKKSVKKGVEEESKGSDCESQISTKEDCQSSKGGDIIKDVFDIVDKHGDKIVKKWKKTFDTRKGKGDKDSKKEDCESSKKQDSVSVGSGNLETESCYEESVSKGSEYESCQQSDSVSKGKQHSGKKY